MLKSVQITAQEAKRECTHKRRKGILFTRNTMNHLRFQCNGTAQASDKWEFN